MSASSNGTAAPAPDIRTQAREARARVRLLEAQLTAKKLERSAKLLESVGDVTSTWDWVSAYSDLITRFRNEPNSFQPSTLNDRRYGRNFPLFQSEAELALIRMPSRVCAQTNPYAMGLERGLRSYVVSDGYTYRATSENDNESELCAAVQKIIDKHIERNQWSGGEMGSLEHELFDRSIEDGEFFLRHFERDDGWTDVRTVEPEQIRQPGVWSSEIGMFGVRHAKNDAQNIEAYWVTYSGNPSEGDEVSKKELIHFPRNRKRSILRGLPEFSFQTYDALEMADRLSRAMGLGGAIQASIVGVREHQAATGAEVDNFTDMLSDFQRPDLLTGQLNNFTRFQPGQWLDVPQALKFVPPPAWTTTNQFVDILHALLRKAGVRWNAPEWLATSSGGDMAAYTASLTAESPFLRTIHAEQVNYKAAFRRSIWIAVENRIRAKGGRIFARNKDGTGGREYTLDDVRRLVTIQVEAPPAEARNKLEEVQANVARLQGGWKSPQTIQQEEGLDTDRELTNLEEWHERTGGQGNPLQLPPEQGDEPGAGLSPPGGPPPGSPKPPNPNTPPQKLPTPESREVRESREVVGPTWLHVPVITQTTDFSCGAACYVAVAKFLGGHPNTEDAAIRELQSSPSDGTLPSHIITVAVDNGLNAAFHDDMDLDDLARYTNAGRPVIIAMQAWGDDEDYLRDESGHYVVVCGVDGGELHLMDPVLDDYATINAEDFMSRWHDVGGDGERYDRFGIALWGGKRSGAVRESKDSTGHEHKGKGPGGGQFTKGGGGGGTAKKAGSAASKADSTAHPGAAHGSSVKVTPTTPAAVADVRIGRKFKHGGQEWTVVAVRGNGRIAIKSATDQKSVDQATFQQMAGSEPAAKSRTVGVKGSVPVVGTTKLEKDASRTSLSDFMDKYHRTVTGDASLDDKYEMVHEVAKVSDLDPLEHDWGALTAHQPEKIKAFANYMRQGGKIDPVLVTGLLGGEENPEVQEGHHRVEAAMQAGFTHIPIMYGIDTLAGLWGKQHGSDKTGRQLAKEYLEGKGHKVAEGQDAGLEECGGEGGKPGPCPDGSSSGSKDTPPTPHIPPVAHSALQGAQAILKAAGRLSGKAAAQAKSFAVNKFKKLEARYGRAGAIAVMSASVALTPVPLPGTSLAPVLIAEGFLQAAKLWRGKTALESDWSENKHPRRDDGKFGTGGGQAAKGDVSPAIAHDAPVKLSAYARQIHGVLAGKIDATPGLSDQHKATYKKGMELALHKIPDAALSRIAANSKKVQFYANHKDIVPALLEDHPGDAKLMALVERGGEAGGCYDSHALKLHLNGKVPVHGGEAPGKSRENVHETYCHELGHAIDGPNKDISRSDEWRAAWQQEIGSGKPEAGKLPALSSYAMTSPSEGLAEFSRLVYGTKRDRSYIQQRFPKCASMWEKHKLW